MSTSSRTPAEWDELFVRYLASGQTQRSFCEYNNVGFDAFRGRYQKSERFAGKRRRSRASSNAAAAASGFVAVRTRPATVTPAASATVTIRLDGGVTIECPIALGTETIARLAREAVR